MKKLLIQISILLTTITVNAQQTSRYINNWYLGDGVGLTFNSGSIATTTSAISAYEVSTSYSDGAGNVLFYGGANGTTTGGNGFTLWDASHNTMPNGDISIDYSSSCGLITASVPGSCDQCYIFHMTSTGPGWGVHYSTVDMTLAGNGTVGSPLGDIVAGQKDVMVYGADQLCEKLKIVQQGNTENYWVIARSMTLDVFYSFEVTSAGINTTPIISTISAATFPSAPLFSPIFSWIAVNKDRDLIAEASGFMPNIVLYNFNNITGVLSFAEEIMPIGTFGTDIPYGLDFSPDGNVLYNSRFAAGNSTYISYYDITAGVGSIGATRQDFLISSSPTGEYGGLIKGPDGKLYMAQYQMKDLTVINDPNNFSAPNIVIQGQSVGADSAIIGMPNMAYYYHPDNFIDSLAGGDRVVCPNGQTNIGATGNDSIWGAYYWEPSAMVLNPNNANTLTVSLPVNQQFILAVLNNCGDTIKTDTVWVSATCSVLPIQLLDFEASCEDGKVLLNWSTASEINNDYFTLEKSTDASNFESIGAVNGNGNSVTVNNYSWTDDELSGGTTYYRLKQTDFNGAFEYHGIRTVTCEQSTNISLYPNPFGNSFTVQLPENTIYPVTIEVIDYLGRQVYTKAIDSQSAEIILNELSSGTYFVKVFNETTQIV